MSGVPRGRRASVTTFLWAGTIFVVAIYGEHSSGDPRTGRTRILLVHPWGAALAMVLTQLGLNAAAVDDMLEAVAAMTRERPGLVLTEDSLPDGSGLELCLEAKARPELAEVRFAMFTDHDVPKERLRAAGFESLLKTSLHPTAVTDSLEQLADGCVDAAKGLLGGLFEAIDALLASPVPRGVPALPPLDTSSPLVLVVDRDDEFRQELALGLRQRRIRHTPAKRMKDAARLIETRNPDLVVVEEFLGGDDIGRELCRQTKLNPSRATLPFILKARYEQPDYWLRKSGIDVCVREPVEIEYLAERIELVLKGA